MTRHPSDRPAAEPRVTDYQIDWLREWADKTIHRRELGAEDGYCTVALLLYDLLSEIEKARQVRQDIVEKMLRVDRLSEERDQIIRVMGPWAHPGVSLAESISELRRVAEGEQTEVVRREP